MQETNWTGFSSKRKIFEFEYNFGGNICDMVFMFVNGHNMGTYFESTYNHKSYVANDVFLFYSFSAVFISSFSKNKTLKP